MSRHRLNLIGISPRQKGAGNGHKETKPRYRVRIVRFMVLLLKDLFLFGILLLVLGGIAYSASDFVAALAIISVGILVSGSIIYWLMSRWRDSKKSENTSCSQLQMR